MEKKKFSIVISYIFEVESTREWGPNNTEIRRVLKERFPNMKRTEYEIDCIDEID